VVVATAEVGVELEVGAVDEEDEDVLAGLLDVVVVADLDGFEPQAPTRTSAAVSVAAVLV
jgi:hypothetical protein